MERRAGFEPATSRVADEVTAIFTTDRDRVGGERAMLLLPLAAPPPSPRFEPACTGLPVRRLYRSNRHLHHRLADACASAIERHAGEQAISASVSSTHVLLSERSEPWRVRPSRGRLHGACSQAGFEPAFTRERSIRNLHHQRRLSREMRQTEIKINFFAALERRRYCEPLLVRSAIGIRLIASFPPTGPARWAHASRREPRDPGLPFRLSPGYFQTSLLRTIKNPPELLAREGSCRTDCRFRLCEFAPMSRACGFARQ